MVHVIGQRNSGQVVEATDAAASWKAIGEIVYRLGY